MTLFQKSGFGMPRRVRRSCGKRAFTFIEIMMVVLIIGMLAAIVMPRMAHQAEKARIAKAKAEMTGFATALNLYEMDLGEFPTTDQGLDALVHRPSDVDESKWEKRLDSVPKDPWGSAYIYRCPGENGDDYDLFSAGHDKKEGTDDDISVRNREEATK